MAEAMITGNPYYLVLSIIIMCFASYTMLNMIEQPQPKEKMYGFNWMIGGASVFGLGLWTMHVVSLLASDYRMVMDWSMLLVLVVCAIIVYSSLLVLKNQQLKRVRYFISSLLMALGATMLQYISMLSESVVILQINWLLYWLSFGVGFVGAYLAFCWLESKSPYYKLKSCLSLGLSNMAIHQVGMHALKVEYDNVLSTDLLNEYLLLLAFLLGLSTLIILSFSLTTWLASNKYRQIDERYKLLVENSMDTIALISDGKWEFMNRAGLCMFEVQSERELIGQSVYSLLSESYHKEMRVWLAAGQEHDHTTAKPLELQWLSMRGTLLHTEMVSASSTFSGKQIKQVIIRDISERKKNEELLINSEKLYVAGQLAAGIAHEIRNPLTSLKGFLQLITSGRGNSSNFYDIMKSELVRIESIVSELLMLSKPQVYEFVHKDSRQIMADTVNLLDTQAILHNVIIEFHSDFRPLWVHGVENQLKQVFINVLKNAIEAMHNGGIVTITMSLDEEKGVLIRIKDEGSGIPDEQLAKIGQPFYTTKDKGTGLGLMVTYKIIDNHQGRISAESKLGVGTTFVIQLPYKEVPDIQEVGTETVI
ncbi:ATP-binding protein [Paenibacillus sinopodophylli]|uniref:ATP-binding protein n=1 Tax=Paenibacillus sinopodophylli TaxID=1837342 RepID=UPI00110CF5A0|nr:ATP-binding protein [Paenibacillus sinopodophylli]